MKSALRFTSTASARLRRPGDRPALRAS